MLHMCPRVALSCCGGRCWARCPGRCEMQCLLRGGSPRGVHAAAMVATAGLEALCVVVYMSEVGW